MVWKDKRIAVRDVREGPMLDAEGVRDGWDATTDDAIAARMFYPADMFTFEPDESESPCVRSPRRSRRTTDRTTDPRARRARAGSPGGCATCSPASSAAPECRAAQNP